MNKIKVGAALVLIGGLSFGAVYGLYKGQILPGVTVTEELLAKRLTPIVNSLGAPPVNLEIPLSPRSSSTKKISLDLTLDPTLSEKIRGYLSRYKPDYAAIAALDINTGEILALESFTREPEDLQGHLALQTPFPAASIFKIVTAAAAIDSGKAFANTPMPYVGRSTTLYRKQIQDERMLNRWAREVTLREAFGKSINPVFGKLGLFKIGGSELLNYAEKFFFNKHIPSDLEIQKSQFFLDKDNPWEVVESSAGFTNRTSLSPIHGAMIAGSILSDGKMMKPHIVRRVYDDQGETIYLNVPQDLGPTMVPFAAEQMKMLMEETVVRGTSRKPFRGFIPRHSDPEENIEFVLGGKTGSLDSDALKGRTDWFVGYGSDGSRNIAVGIVTVNKKFWVIKSSMLARMIFEDIFTKPKKSKQSRIERASTAKAALRSSRGANRRIASVNNLQSKKQSRKVRQKRTL